MPTPKISPKDRHSSFFIDIYRDVFLKFLAPDGSLWLLIAIFSVYPLSPKEFLSGFFYRFLEQPWGLVIQSVTRCLHTWKWLLHHCFLQLSGQSSVTRQSTSTPRSRKSKSSSELKQSNFFKSLNKRKITSEFLSHHLL